MMKELIMVNTNCGLECFPKPHHMAARREQHKMEKTLLSVRRAVLHIRAPTTAKLKLRGHRVAEMEHAACRIDAHKLHAKSQSSLACKPGNLIFLKTAAIRGR